MPIAAIGINQAKLPTAQGGDEERTGARVPGDTSGKCRRRCNKKEKRLKRNMSMTLIRTRIARVGSRSSRHQPGKRQCATKNRSNRRKENRPVRAVEVTANHYFRAS